MPKLQPHSLRTLLPAAHNPIGVPGKTTCIRQEIYLPVHRELHYRGSVYVKHLSGADEIAVSIRKRNSDDQILATARFAASSAQWRKYSFSLNLPERAIASLEPADFVIEVSGDDRALVDEASLIPADALDGLNPDMVALAKAMHTTPCSVSAETSRPHIIGATVSGAR